MILPGFRLFFAYCSSFTKYQNKWRLLIKIINITKTKVLKNRNSVL